MTFQSQPNYYINDHILCIPRVSNANEKFIYNIISSHKLGVIDHIDIAPSNKKETRYDRVFIHLKCWNNNETAKEARKQLLRGNEIKVNYDDFLLGKFWRITAYKINSKKMEQNEVMLMKAEDIKYGN